ncbi:MAG: DUF4174 domain-containing protein [Paracoccaceae bacterium]
MKHLITLIVLGVFGLSANAQDSTPVTGTEPGGLEIVSAKDVSMDDFLWLKRLVVIFADTERDPSFIKQMALLETRTGDLVARDVVVITDANPADDTAIREQLRPRGFSLVLVDLDGRVKLRKPSPWSTREIVRSIDKTQLRRDELRGAR